MTGPANMDIPDHLFTAIDHVGIAVADLDVATAFYRDTFGMEAMLRVGPAGDPSGAMIQLLAPLDDSSTIAAFLDRKGPGIQQLAYRVTDVEAVAQVLRDRGLRLLYDEPRRGTNDSRVNFVHPKDAGGVLIELVEPA